MTRFAGVARGVAWRSVHGTLANPAILLPSIAFPLFFLAAFAGGLSRLADLPRFHYALGYTAFQFVYVFLQASAFGGVFTGFAVARDFESGFARRLLLAAHRRSGLIAGYAIGALARWAIAATLVTVAAFIGGMTVGGDGVDLLGVAAIGMLVNLATGLWAFGVATFLRTEQAGTLIQMPVLVLLFLAPVYVPLNLLSGWVHAAARVNPATDVLEAGRGLLAGSPTKVLVSFVLLILSVLALAVWARRGLASAERAG